MEYALLTGSSSIYHALDCALRLAAVVGVDRPDWELALRRPGRVVRTMPEAFEPKDRWAMDWYYPVLCNVLLGAPAERRLAALWDTFVMPGLGVRCVSDEPWVTAAETAECAIAHAAVGDKATATRPAAAGPGRIATRTARTGRAWSTRKRVNFPAGERTAYTAAAVILAADAISGASAASGIFIPADGRSPPDRRPAGPRFLHGGVGSVVLTRTSRHLRAELAGRAAGRVGRPGGRAGAARSGGFDAAQHSEGAGGRLGTKRPLATAGR